jgi:signal peptidase II
LTARRVLAVALAVSVILLNLGIEHVLIALQGPVILAPGFLDYLPALNRGVSFGLLRQDGDTGRLVLILALAIVTAFVAFLAWRSATRLQAAGYGLVMGGAIGNLADRVFGGAVFDYLSLHLGRLPLFVFNFSDAAISIGVVLLAVDSLLSSRAAVTDS